MGLQVTTTEPQHPPSDPQLRAALRQIGGATVAVLSTTSGLVAMYAVAFALRLLIAPHVAFYRDVFVHINNATRLHDGGIAQLVNFSEPGVIVPVWYQLFSALPGLVSRTPSLLLIKAPIFVADLLLAFVASRIAAERYERTDPRRNRATIAVAAAVLFGPAVLGVGAAWGQIEAIPMVFTALGGLLLVGGATSLRRDAAALAAFACAFAVKPHATFFAPVVLYVLIRRYVLHQVDARHRLLGGVKVAGLAAMGGALWAVSSLPFGVSIGEQFTRYREASGSTSTSANAFNFWGIFGFWRGDSGRGSQYPELSFLWLESRYVGLLLFAAGCAIVLRRLHRSLDGGAHPVTAYLWASATTSMLAFTFLTRMHERFAIYAIVLFAPLATTKPLRRLYVALSVFYLANLWYALAYFNVGVRESNPGIGARDLRFEPWISWAFGDLFVNPTPMKRLWSVVGVVLCVALVSGGKRWLGQPAAEHTSRLTSLWRGWRAHLSATLSNEPVTEARGDGTPRTQRWWVWGGVAAVVAWWLGALNVQLRATPPINDSSFHMQMVRWAEAQMRGGRLPLDGWFPDLTLGSAFFHYYQSLSYNLTALLSLVTPASPDTAYRALLWLLVATWPVAVYLGARWFDLSRAVALIAAALALTVNSVTGYGFEIGSYTWGGYGMYTQLFGMWLMPLALGLTWKALHRDGNLAWSAMALALTMALHFMTGYLTMVIVVALVLAAPSREVATRAALAVGGSIVTASWVLVPLLRDRRYAAVSEWYVGSIFNDSHGAGKIVRWLVSGSLFDEGRLPVVTALAALGATVCVVRWKHDARCRALLLAFAFSLLLFFGRVTWGGFTALLPGDDNLQMHRFIAGMHLTGIMLAAVGTMSLVGAVGKIRLPTSLKHADRLRLALSVGVVVLLFAPAFINRTEYALKDRDYLDAQDAADTTDGADVDRLLDLVASRNDGRVYGGTRGNWAVNYKVYSRDVHQFISQRDLDGVGFTFRTMPSLSTDIEARIDDNNLAHFEMMNIKYLVLPDDRTPGVPATLLEAAGRWRLYEVQTTGYIDVVNRGQAIYADRATISERTQQFRSRQDAVVGLYPGIAFDGHPVPEPTASGKPTSRPGRVISQSHQRADGKFTAQVELSQTGVVLLKSTYDPGWRAYVDGVEQPTVMMAPSIVGVDVESGTHTVEFRYRSYGGYPLLLALGVATIAALVAYERRRRLRVER